MTRKSIFSVILPCALVALPFLVFPALELERAMAAAVFVATVLLWFTEALPLAVTGMLVPVLAICSGVLAPEQAFGAFGNQILFLFIGSFLLARSMQKHGWDRRMAYWILSTRLGSYSLNALVCLTALVCWLLSMWVSNTATCAMMAPICLGIASTLEELFSTEEEYRRFTTRILLACAFASSTGGMATPVGSPPNLLAIQFLQQQGVPVSFLSWLILALPISVGMLVLVLVLLAVRFPIQQNISADIREHFQEKLAELGKIQLAEVQTAGCFLLAVVLWILPDILVQVSPGELTQAFKSRMPMGAVALVASTLLFVCGQTNADGEFKRCLCWDDAAGIDWGTVLLFGGGLCLGAVLDHSGLATQIGNTVIPQSSESILWPLTVVVVLGVLISEFSSNTASSSILIPVILATAYGATTATASQFVIGAAFGASFGFMLPVSTPPNAIVYGTGKVRLSDMIRAGVLFDILGATLIVLYLGVFVG